MSVRIAAVQLEFKYLSAPQLFADHVRAPIERAAQSGAELILLPHLTSAMLFGMFDSDANSYESLARLAARQQQAPREWLLDRAGYILEFYTHLFQSLAARVETWLAPGTVFERDGEVLFLSAFLFNPAGESVGRQRQLHPRSEDLEWGVVPGDTIRVFETDLGNYGFLIDNDTRHPDVAREFAAHGADILLHPAGTYSIDDVPGSTRFLNAVQMNKVFGITADMHGGIFHGHSAIYSPSELTPDKSGILAQTGSENDKGVILANLDLQALQRLRAQAPS